MKFFHSQKAKDLFIRNASLFLAIIGIVIGVFLSTRYNEKIPRVITPGVPYLSLQDMVDKFDKEHAELKDQISKTDEDISKLESQTKQKQVGLSGLVELSDKLKKDSGLIEESGDGIVILLDDTDSKSYTVNSIAHASDMRDLVDYLWAASAQAVSIAGAGDIEERVGPTTSIDCIVNTVLINGTKMVPPFQIKAIGDRDSLMTAINDRNVLKSIYDRVENEGLKFYVVDGVDKVTVSKFTGNIITQHVKIK